LAKPGDLDDVAKAVEAVSQHGAKAAAARALGIPVTTLNDRLSRAARLGMQAQEPPPTFEVGELPDELPRGVARPAQ
jgi:hypothetical protein